MFSGGLEIDTGFDVVGAQLFCFVHGNQMCRQKVENIRRRDLRVPVAVLYNYFCRRYIGSLPRRVAQAVEQKTVYRGQVQYTPSGFRGNARTAGADEQNAADCSIRRAGTIEENKDVREAPCFLKSS